MPTHNKLPEAHMGSQTLIGLGIFEDPEWMSSYPSPSRSCFKSTRPQGHKAQNEALAALVRNSEPLGWFQPSVPMLPLSPIELGGRLLQRDSISNWTPRSIWTPLSDDSFWDAEVPEDFSLHTNCFESCHFCGEPICLDPTSRLRRSSTVDSYEMDDSCPRQILEYFDSMEGWLRAPPNWFATSKFGAVGERLAPAKTSKSKTNSKA